jgi:hypothetical protein
MLPELVNHLTRPGQPTTEIAEADWLVVVSQTCDIVAPKLEAEPLVEVLHCKPHAGKPRKGRRNLESTRYLDFRPNTATHQNLVLTAHAIADRYVIPRQLLTGHAPDSVRELSAASSQRLLAWYALRAGRPSWPNTFCDRVRTVRAALEEALDALSDDIAEVRVGIVEKDEELAPEQAYHVIVFFIVDEDVWNADVDGRKVIHDAFAKFVAELSACDGVSVDQDESAVVPGNEFSWQETKLTDLWDFANLSHRD